MHVDKSPDSAGTLTTPVRRSSMRRLTLSILAVVTAVIGALAGAPTAQAATAHTVTFVNKTAEKVWIGSTVNADGSVPIAKLPILSPGASATITIGHNSGPGHWRGKFFARQRCTGTSGSTFHCAVGDCGNIADRCAINSEQPTGLAEFNLDRRDKLAPWYNVSYVNGVAMPITIRPTGAAPPPPGSEVCAEAGCPGRILDACPAEALRRDPAGKPLVCVNPNRDAVTAYSRAIAKRCPRAYSWSKHDTEPGNKTVYNCPNCKGFVVTFNSI